MSLKNLSYKSIFTENPMQLYKENDIVKQFFCLICILHTTSNYTGVKSYIVKYLDPGTFTKSCLSCLLKEVSFL